MITKMTKYSMILLSGDLERFLSGVQELGMVDITRSVTGTDDASREMTSLIGRCRAAAASLHALAKEHREASASAGDSAVPPAADLSAEELLNAFEGNAARREEIASELDALDKEYRKALPWGEFSPSDVDRLRAAGLTPHFYCVSDKRLSPSWEEQYPLQVLARDNGNICFVVLTRTDAAGDDMDAAGLPAAEETQLPPRPASQVQAGMQALRSENDRLVAEALGYASRSSELSELADRTFASLDLHLAGTSSLLEGEGTISVVEGFAPTADDAAVQEYLEHGPCTVYWQAEAAKGADNPPIKLRNNWFARLFEPVGGLYELPNYDELDLTPYFAPFYMLFFGFCLGDMGYGLILVITGIAVALALPKFSGYGKLIAWLGVGSLILPLFSGTFFGMKGHIRLLQAALGRGSDRGGMEHAHRVGRLRIRRLTDGDQAAAQRSGAGTGLRRTGAGAVLQQAGQVLPAASAQGHCLPLRHHQHLRRHALVHPSVRTGYDGRYPRPGDQLHSHDSLGHPLRGLAGHCHIPHLRTPGRHGPVVPRSIRTSGPSDLRGVLQECGLRGRRKGLQTTEII